MSRFVKALATHRFRFDSMRAPWVPAALAMAMPVGGAAAAGSGPAAVATARIAPSEGGMAVSPRSVPVGPVKFVVRNASTRPRTFGVAGKGGLVYASFTSRDGRIRVIEYRRSTADPDSIDRTQRRVLIALTKQTADHNGGMMQFGPDGYLYIAVGDGGADLPRVPVGITGQTLTDLFGSILRIDPRHGTPYAIPPTNPFAANRIYVTSAAGAVYRIDPE
jgi:glucose/arabinose dehydrogenase